VWDEILVKAQELLCLSVNPVCILTRLISLLAEKGSISRGCKADLLKGMWHCLSMNFVNWKSTYVLNEIQSCTLMNPSLSHDLSVLKSLLFFICMQL